MFLGNTQNHEMSNSRRIRAISRGEGRGKLDPYQACGLLLSPDRDPSLSSEPAPLEKRRDDTLEAASFDSQNVFFEMDWPLWSSVSGEVVFNGITRCSTA